MIQIGVLTLGNIKPIHLTRLKMLEYLDNLSANSQPDQLTLFIPPRLSPEKLAEMVNKVTAATDIHKEIYDICTSSANGAIIFKDRQKTSLVVPPFPIRDIVMMAGFEPEHLKAMLSRDYVIGLVLIRLGSYGIGVCKGDKLITSKVGTGLVHSRHRQGGSSSHRFERHRDKQMEIFFNRVCGHVREQLEPYTWQIDYIVYGGAWETIQLFIKYCPFLSKLDKPVLPTLSDTPEPRHDVLEKAVGRILSSTVYEWNEEK
jgi:peptide subunit release factor 1 (eRF1)